MSAFQCSLFVQYSNFIPSLRSSQSLCLFYHIVKKKAIFLSFEIYYNIDEFYMLKLSNFIYFSCVSAFFSSYLLCIVSTFCDLCTFAQCFIFWCETSYFSHYFPQSSSISYFLSHSFETSLRSTSHLCALKNPASW